MDGWKKRREKDHGGTVIGSDTSDQLVSKAKRKECIGRPLSL